MNILFSGIGGVGGYYGGIMAAYYGKDPDVSISFFARGENLRMIREEGLHVKFPGGECLARPQVVTDQAEEIGKADYLFLSTKTYNLEENLEQLVPVITPDCVIIPLLNGVDNVDRISKRFPDTEVWGGCSYIVTRKVAPGQICKYSEKDSLWFGHPENSFNRQRELENIFRKSGVNCMATPDISQRLWKKFMLTSTGGTLTSYYDTCIGDVLKNHKDVFIELAQEVFRLAAAHGCQLSLDAPQETLEDITLMPYDSTFSMHTDFLKGNRTELETLVGYPIRAGKKLGVATPIYEMAYEKLRKRENGL